MEPKFFPTPADWRAWLEKHHGSERELLVGFYKKDCGRPSITWPESVDGALCYGWIDGIRRRIDDVSYSIRFTPRRPRSVWSAVNIKRAGELQREGLMQPAGLKAFEARREDRSRVYAFEQPLEKKFRANAAAWKFFQAQPPSYRRIATWWVMSAKREETKARRLTSLIEQSAQGKRII